MVLEMTNTKVKGELLPPRLSQWPPGFQNITAQSYHSSVTAELLSFLCPNSLLGVSGQSNQQPKGSQVVVRPVRDQAHPANGQHGLFAAKKIPARSHILNYLGEVHCDDRPDSDYDLSLHRTQDGISVGIDASKMGNEARFINDYRGIRPRPNAIFEERRAATGELCMSVWSGSEPIRKGDEILVSYGKSWWSARRSSGISDGH